MHVEYFHVLSKFLMVFEMTVSFSVSIVFIMNVKYTSVSERQLGIISKISTAYRF